MAERARAGLDRSKLGGEELAAAFRNIEQLTRSEVFAVSIFVQMLVVGLVVSLIAAVALWRSPQPDSPD